MDASNKTPTEFCQIIQDLQQTLIEKNSLLEEKDIIISESKELIESLQDRLAMVLRLLFAKRSEKLKALDFSSEDENEADSAQEEEEKQEEKQEEEQEEGEEQEEDNEESELVNVSGYTRQKGRKKLPGDLPRLRHEHHLSEEERQCACGAQCEEIGEDISEQLEIIPAIMYVIQQVKKKYACPSCCSKVKQAKAPPQAIPKSNAGPGLLAHIIVSKFCDHLPLYRQETILQRCGTPVSRATLSRWIITCGDLVTPLINLMKDDLIDYDVAYADETTWQVLKEPEREAHQQSYLWLFGGGSPDKFAWIYQYHPSRQATHAKAFFKDYQGYLHVDGYAGYQALDEHVTLVGCFTHARRYFFNIFEAGGKKKKGLAYRALIQIAELYAIESQAKKEQLSPEARYQQRQEKAKPILDAFKAWCEENSEKVPPKSPIGKAFAYTLRQWPKLCRYLEDGRLEIDNNRTERSIKSFVTGRKNWLFNQSPQGATAAANLLSLIETCKVHNVDPYAYLRYVMKKLPIVDTVEDVEALLPYRCHSEDIMNDLNEEKNRIARIMPQDDEGD